MLHRKAIIVKMVPCIKKNEHVLDMPLGMWGNSLSSLECFKHGELAAKCFINEQTPYSFINVMASNHAIKLTNKGTKARAIPSWPQPSR